MAKSLLDVVTELAFMQQHQPLKTLNPEKSEKYVTQIKKGKDKVEKNK